MCIDTEELERNQAFKEFKNSMEGAMDKLEEADPAMAKIIKSMWVKTFIKLTAMEKTRNANRSKADQLINPLVSEVFGLGFNIVLEEKAES